MTVTHRNAPLTPEGRKRLVERCRTRPIAHVAAEMGISRTTASKWVNRYRKFGDLGLHDPLQQALETWNLHYNYHRPHGAHDSEPPASATRHRVNNVLASYI